MEINLLSPDEDQIKWCLERGITPHPFRGEMDDDCEDCGMSIYLAIHTNAFPRLEDLNLA
jgi:hypothetical protein